VVITGNKIAPSLGDHYLAHNGYEAQMHDGPEDPNRPNNLYEPVDDARDYGAHGVFDDRSHAHSYQLWVDQRREWIAVAGAVGAACDAIRNGPGKLWRGGLIGLALGTLGALGLAALSRPDRRLTSDGGSPHPPKGRPKRSPAAELSSSRR
jgi:hypothetical protein